jgi:hypothetical protein
LNNLNEQKNLSSYQKLIEVVPLKNYTMVLGIYASPEFKKSQKESLTQAIDQFDGSNG